MIIRRQINDAGQVWNETLARVVSLFEGCSEEQLATPVLAVEGRTVRDLAALLSGMVDDALSGSARGVLEGAPASGTASELIEQLRERGPRLVTSFDRQQGPLRLIAELSTVEQDLRSTLEQHAARDDDAVILSIEYLAGVMAERLVAAGAPGLRITCEQWGYDTADTCHEILVADRFELFRAMNGRRSAAEVRRWMWSSDPAPFLPYLAVWGSLRDTDLDEVDPTIPPEYAARLRGQNWREPIAR